MPEGNSSPKFIPSRTGACIQCGAPVVIKTNPKVCCETCSKERKKARSRAGMERQRRKKGVPVTKGTVISCQRCCRDFERGGYLRKYCDDCKPIVALEYARVQSARKLQTEEGRAYKQKYERERYRADPSRRVSAHMTTLIHRALKAKKAGRSWREFVPYSLEELMRHLERQFTPEMSWANYGSFWEIDHVRPRSVFNYSTPQCDAFQECWSLLNLRPLSLTDNRRKSKKHLYLL